MGPEEIGLEGEETREEEMKENWKGEKKRREGGKHLSPVF